MSKGGTRSAGEARLIREAVERGWEWLGRNGMNHAVLRWPPTGTVTHIPGSMDDGFVRSVNRRLIKMEKSNVDPG
jgi:hypothetical protein